MKQRNLRHCRLISRCSPGRWLACLLVAIVATGWGAGDIRAETAEDVAERFWARTSGALRDDLDQELARLESRVTTNADGILQLAAMCRVLGDFAYLEDFYWEDIQQRLEDCEERLQEMDADHPEVWLYRVEHAMADEAVALGDELLENGFAGWSDEQIASLYEHLTYQHDWASNGTPGSVAISALTYGVDDPRVIIAAASDYADQNDHVLAAETLSLLSPEVDCWNLAQAAKLAVFDIEDFELAGKLLDIADQRQCQASQYSFEALAAMHESMDRYDDADQALEQAVEHHWRPENMLREWYEKALRDGPPHRALAAYERLRDQGFTVDPLLYHRIRLLVSYPDQPWRVRDLAGVGMLLAMLLCLILLPLLLLVPVHWRGLVRQRAGRLRRFPFTRWNLRHAWLLLSALLLIDVGLNLAFFHDPLIGAFVDDTEFTLELGDPDITNMQLLLLAGMALIVLALLPRGLSTLTPGRWSLLKCVGAGLGFALLLRLLTGIIVVLIEGPSPIAAAPFTEWTILDAYMRFGALATLLLMALAVPLVEEVVFRGVLLASLAKHITFGWANILQAGLFAVMHEDMAMIPFFFAFAMLGGEMFRRSGSLLPAISMHVSNNLLSVGVLIAMQ